MTARKQAKLPFHPACAALLATLALPIAAFAQSAAPATPNAAATPPAATPMAPTGSATTRAATSAPANETAASGPAGKVEQRIRLLHRQLGITAAEETQWDAFAQVMRDNATHMQQTLSQRIDSYSKLNAADNLNSYAAIAQEHAQDVQHLASAFQPLYAALSDEQKQTADRIFRNAAEKHQTARAGKSTKS